MKPSLWALALIAFSFGANGLLTASRGQDSLAKSVLGAPGAVWGGQHLVLEVTDEGANLGFDCATGTIIGAPVTDAQGKFVIKGTLVREHPGPAMRGENPMHYAKYSGKIEGDTLHLVVSEEGSTEPYGEYLLTRGNPGRVVKCR